MSDSQRQLPIAADDSGEGEGKAVPGGSRRDIPAAGVPVHSRPRGAAGLGGAAAAPMGDGRSPRAPSLPSRNRRWRDDHPGIDVLIAVFGHGVGRIRAISILETFGSVRAFDQASRRQRMRVPGIGRELARRWDQVMELPFGDEEERQ